MIDIAVVEDVWGAEFEALQPRFAIARAPEAWRDVTALADLVREARALVVRNRTTVSRALLEQAGRLEVIARAGVGIDNIDMAAADDLGVVVVAASGANARGVAELTIALGLALARDIVGHDRRVRGGRWDRQLGLELRGHTWGVIGLGATGLAVVELATALGMHVVGCDPYLPAGSLTMPPLRQVITPVEVARAADIVSLHVPLTEETRGLVDAEFLSSLRPSSFLINVARGGLVEEQALADALDAGTLAGAALDVRAEEPPRLGRLEASEHVILTPHVAGLTVEAQRTVASMLAGDVERVLSGSPAACGMGRWRLPRERDAARHRTQ